MVARIEAAGGRGRGGPGRHLGRRGRGTHVPEVDRNRVRRRRRADQQCRHHVDRATIADSDDALFDRHIAVNLKGTFNTLREAARRLRDGGRIVNFSSSVTGLLQPTYGVYAATKAAVEAMTSILAKELRGRNITVNAVAPGPTATKLFLDSKRREVIVTASQAGAAGTAGPAARISPTRWPSSKVRTAPGSAAEHCAGNGGII